MSKKVIITIICSVVVLVIAALSAIILYEPDMSTDDVLPSGVLSYVKITNIKDTISKIISSDLYTSIINIDSKKLLDDGLIEKDQKEYFDLIKEKSLVLSDNIELIRLLGKEIVVAFYPAELNIDFNENMTQENMLEAIEGLLSNISVAVHLQPEAKFLEFVARFSSNKDLNDIKQEVIDYKEEKIYLISVPESDIKIGYVKIGDILVAGIGDQSAKKAVDVFNGDITSLDEDLDLTKARKNYVDSPVFTSFLNVGRLRSLIEKELEKIPVDVLDNTKQIKEGLRSWSGFKFVTASFNLEDILKSRINVYIDQTKLKNVPFVKICNPSYNNTFDFIPRDTIAYYWDSCLDLDYYWQEFKKEIDSSDSDVASDIENNIAKFQKTSGLNVEQDILGAFSNEIGGALFDIKLTGAFPIPEFVLFVKIKDKDKSEKLMNKLLDKSFFMLAKDNYSGINIRYINSPISVIRPGYSYIGDYMAISINKDLIKKSIDVYTKKSESIKNNPSLKEIDFGLTDKNISVLFGKVDRIFERLEGIINFATMWSNAKNNELLAFKKGTVKRLEDIDKSVNSASKEVAGIQQQIDLLEDQIWDFQAENKDASQLEIQKKDLLASLNKKQGDIVALEEKKEELTGVLDMYKKSSEEAKMRKLALDAVVFPILRSFSSVDSFGLRKTFYDDVVEVTTFLKEKQSDKQ